MERRRVVGGKRARPFRSRSEQLDEAEEGEDKKKITQGRQEGTKFTNRYLKFVYSLFVCLFVLRRSSPEP